MITTHQYVQDIIPKDETNKKLDLQMEHQLLYSSGLNPTLFSKLINTWVLHQIYSAIREKKFRISLIMNFKVPHQHSSCFSSSAKYKGQCLHQWPSVLQWWHLPTLSCFFFSLSLFLKFSCSLVAGAFPFEILGRALYDSAPEVHFFLVFGGEFLSA